MFGRSAFILGSTVIAVMMGQSRSTESGREKSTYLTTSESSSISIASAASFSQLRSWFCFLTRCWCASICLANRIRSLRWSTNVSSMVISGISVSSKVTALGVPSLPTETGTVPLTTTQTRQKRFHYPPLVGGTHEQAEAFAHRTCRPTVSVNKDIRGTRNLIVYNMVNGWYIQSSCCDIGRQENGVRSGFESVMLR